MDRFRVLVCGGRAYKGRNFVFEALDALWEIHDCKLVVIEGEAPGADSFAREWAENKPGVDCEPYPAAWSVYGSDAGTIRNAEMLTKGEPDLVVAFPGGRGTRNMVNQARQAGVEVVYGEEIANAAQTR